MTKATEYVYRSNVGELKKWLEQFADDTELFIGGTPDAGYVVAGKNDAEERVFALFDDKEQA
jgi:hypothetical protein